MSYSRLFIALNQGCEDYAKDVRGSVGRCIIELRNSSGRLYLQAQGLKSDCDYRVCLLTLNSYEEVTRPLYVDGSGKGELKWEFTPSELSINIADVKAVAVLVKDKAPLIGFTEGEYNWQRCLVADRSAVAEIAAANVVEHDDDSEDKEKLICIINEIDKEIDDLKHYSAIGTKEAEEALFSRKSFKPFGDDNINWIKANLKELCIVKALWKYINNPFVIKGCRDYRHIILGRENDVYYLGVPSIFDKDYKLEAMAQGFSQFKSADGRPLEQGAMCYCILKV